jgi:hypothetical protein
VLSVGGGHIQATPVKHVWVIDPENESFGYTFGPSGREFAPLSNYYDGSGMTASTPHRSKWKPTLIATGR